MAFGVLDLSIITDCLLEELRACRGTSRLWVENRPAGSPPPVPPNITFTGLAPDAARTRGGCQVSLYLFHVEPDKYNRNTYRDGGRAQQTPQQPMALTLHYLLTAFSPTSYVEEQQAMSIALKCFHERPTIEATVPIDGRMESFTISLDTESVEEVGRLWQSISLPMRLCALYRVSVAFLSPPDMPVIARPVLRYTLDIQPVSGQLPATSALATMTGPTIATIKGNGFVDGNVELRLGRHNLVSTTDNPPAAGQYRVVDPQTIELALPATTASGRYVIWLRRDPDVPVAQAWLEVP